MRRDAVAHRYTLRRQPLTTLDVWIGWLHVDNFREGWVGKPPPGVAVPAVRACPYCQGDWCRACAWTGLRHVGS